MGENVSASPRAGNANAAAWEGRSLYKGTYLNVCPKAQNNCAPRSGKIAIFVF